MSYPEKEPIVLSNVLRGFINKNKKLKLGLIKKRIFDIFKIKTVEFSGHIEIVDFKNQILYIKINLPVLKQEISFSKDYLMESINTELGGEYIKKITLI